MITLKIKPNIERVLLRLVHYSREMSPVIMPGQLKAQENLYCGEIIDPGDTKFKKGQVVYYSEYSASAVRNYGSVLRGEQTLGEVQKDTQYFVVASDDILAYEEEVFDFKKPEGEAVDPWKKKDIPQILTTK